MFRSDKSLSPDSKLHPADSYPLNGTHFTYEKAKLKALSQKKVGKLLVSREDTVVTKTRNSRLKRKLEDERTGDIRPKRRRMNSSIDKTANQVDGGNGTSAGVQDAREIIEARRACRLENEKVAVQKDKLENKEEVCADKQRSKERLKVTSVQRVRSNVNIYDNTNKLDKSLIKVVDQNLNNLTDSMNRENLKDIYSKKLQDISDLSPFKGQMSAFEISLLKGRQNLERRKSIESATLRSSPRMNANVPKPDYREKKRKNSRLSLASSLDRHSEKLAKRGKQTVKQERKRTRTTEGVGSHSPNSEENKVVLPKRRKSKADIKPPKSYDSEITFNLR